MKWFKREPAETEPNIRDTLTSVPEELEKMHKYTQRQYEKQNKMEFEERLQRQKYLTRRTKPPFRPMTPIREGGRTRKRFR